jgi:LmbE family N-acetylglucosaminyl deacetylase
MQPTVIYTHHGGDLNVDHRIVHQAVMTALRPMPSSIYKAIYAFEVASSTEWASSAIGEPFRPDHFVCIETTLQRKIEALHAYDQEMRDFPHARSYDALRALAILRGSSVGLPAAEGFVTLRSLAR